MGRPMVAVIGLSTTLHAPSALMSQNARSKKVMLGGSGGLSGGAGCGGCVGRPAICEIKLSMTLTTLEALCDVLHGAQNRDAHAPLATDQGHRPHAKILSEAELGAALA